MTQNKLCACRYFVLVSVTLLLASLLQLGCRGAKHRAEYISKGDKMIIAVEIVPKHTFLAEYDRFAILVVNGKEVVRSKLFPDSGGYASSNLYRCSPMLYMLQGYFDTWVVDVNAGTITEGKCQSSNPEYVGIFEGGGSRSWNFYSSSERKEMKLEPKGG